MCEIGKSKGVVGAQAAKRPGQRGLAEAFAEASVDA
jgi:hypothetical protein